MVRLASVLTLLLTNKRLKSSTGLATLVAILVSAGVLTSPHVAFAASASSNCNALTPTGVVDKSTNFGNQIGSWQWDNNSSHVIVACNNYKPDSNQAHLASGRVASSGFGDAFQCEELVQRYANARWGDNPYSSWGNGAANTWASGGHPSHFNSYSNNGTYPTPVPGDIFVWNYNHIAIVAKVTSTQIFTLEQNLLWHDPMDGSVNAYNYSTSNGYATVSSSGLDGWLHSNDVSGSGAQILSNNTGLGGGTNLPLTGIPGIYSGGGTSLTSLAANNTLKDNAGGVQVVQHRSDNNIWYIGQVPQQGGGLGWNAWTNNLGANSTSGMFTGNPVLTLNNGKGLEIFVLGSNGDIWHNAQSSPYASWQGWQDMGGTATGAQITGNPTVLKDANGALHLFVRASDNYIYRLEMQQVNGQLQWSPPWQPIGYKAGLSTFTGDPTVVLNNTNGLEIFARNSNGDIWHDAQNAPNSTWSDWLDMGGTSTGVQIVGNPTAVKDASGALHLFVRASDNYIYRLEMQRVNGQLQWNPPWQPIGYKAGLSTFTGDPYVAINSANGLEIFALNSNGDVWHDSQSAPNSTWSDWYPMGGPVTFSGTPGVTMNSVNGLEVFAQQSNSNQMWHIAQSPSWGQWLPM